MRSLWTLAFSFLSAPAFAAGANVIDPIASVPYVQQQLAATAAAPQFIEIASFPAPVPDNACADLGWKFTYYNAIPGQPLAALPLASLSLSLRNVGGQCVWATAQQAESGTSDGTAALNALIFSGNLLTVDSAINLAAAAEPAGFHVTGVVLDAEIGANGQLAPFYTLDSDVCFAASAVRINGFDGSVAAGAPIDACSYRANVLIAEHVSGLTGGTRADVRVYRDGTVLFFTDTQVASVATLSADRTAELTALVQNLVPGPLQDVTQNPSAPCQANTPDALYDAVQANGTLISLAETRADCHVLLLGQSGAANLKVTLDDLLALGPTFSH